MSTVRQHVRRTSHGKVIVRRHHRSNPGSHLRPIANLGFSGKTGLQANIGVKRGNTQAVVSVNSDGLSGSAQLSVNKKLDVGATISPQGVETFAKIKSNKKVQAKLGYNVTTGTPSFYPNYNLPNFSDISYKPRKARSKVWR